MPILIVNQQEVRRLLTMDACIDAIERAARTLAEGNAVQPLRPVVKVPDGVLGLMPGALGDPPMLGVKILAIFPGNHGAGNLDSHQGAVLCFDPATGAPTALLDASEITAVRTAAASAVATRALARKDAGDVAILGTGTQARSHVEAMRAVCDVRRLRIWGRNAERTREFAERVGGEAVASAREAVEGADVVCTTTGAHEPIVEGAWLIPGAHINAAGACVPSDRELDTEAVRRSRVIVDRLESALHEAGDLLIPIAEGVLDETHTAGELGDVLLGRIPGRRRPGEITLFESLGIAAWDLAAAHVILENARAQGAGTEIELGGRRLV